MNPQNIEERWEVEACGQVYEAAFEELPEWISEGSLVPGDKVRRGKLRWIEAGKVPSLIPFFKARASGLPMPDAFTARNPKPEKEDQSEQSSESKFAILVPDVPNFPGQNDEIRSSNASAKAIGGEIPDASACSVHGESATAYFCDDCEAAFCKACPKSYGGTVKICPDCGGLCKPIGNLRRERGENKLKDSGFGRADFLNALNYPFRFKTSLLFGGLMFTFFTIGQSVSAIGGIFLSAAALVCVLLANMLTFGVLANTVANFTKGEFDADFMPSFDDFSLWGDVVHPFFLSIGVYISSFGPFVLAMIVGIYLIFSSLSSHREVFENQVAKVPGTHYYAPDNLAEQSAEVRKLLERAAAESKARFEQHNRTTTSNGGGVPFDPSEKNQPLFEMSQSGTGSLETGKGATKQQSEIELQAMISGALNLGGPLVIVGILTFLWGVFYFPAACAVAGYSRSFLAVVNPTIGIDTIRRLGFTYVKILLMGLAIVIASAIAGGVSAFVLSPFELPVFGNLPAKVVVSLFGFYFSIVFSCVIGYALYKGSDRLQLPS